MQNLPIARPVDREAKGGSQVGRPTPMLAHGAALGLVKSCVCVLAQSCGRPECRGREACGGLKCASKVALIEKAKP
jgi:hypothetical protein